MPTPGRYKDKTHFMEDCMHTTKQEGLTPEQGLGKCLNMWRQDKGGKKPPKKKKMARNVVSKFIIREWIKDDEPIQQSPPVISKLPAPQYSKDRLEDLLKYCQDRLEREGKPLNIDTLEKAIALIKEDLKSQKTASSILTCPDCGFDLDNTKGMDPTKNLIICPKCGEFMYQKEGFDITDPRLNPEYIKDHTNCPVCGNHYKVTCRCRVGDKVCPNNHTWHTCGEHNRVFLGSSHDKGCLKEVNGKMSNCVCPSR